MMRTMEASITAHSRTVGDAMRTVLSTAVSNINRMKPEFETAGKNAGQGFINGINSKLGGARSAGRSLGLAALEAAKKALDSHSPSREFIHLGENVGEGLAIGVNNSIVPAAQAASGMIDEVIAVSEKGVDAFEDWINEKQYYGELSLMDELAGWENLQKKYRAGSEERMKIDREVYRVQNELVSATYQASLDWIEEEKYYKRLSTEEELAAYERMQARYLEGSKERMELDRKVFTLRNQLVDESYQNSMDWIEEEKYYNRLSLADELAAYKRVQSRYAKGTEERKKLDREVYRLEQEIYEAQQQYIADVQSVQESANQRRIQLEEAYANKVKSINEQLERDIESLNQQYQDAVESRTKSLYQSYGLFDEVAKKEAVSSETLMQNLEGQVQEFGEWQDILGQLSARGVDSDLIAELQEMGPSAIEEIRALNSMSDDELEKYVSLWSIKHAQARDQATSELEGLRVETQEQIAQLRADAAVELEEYRLTWQSEMAQLEEDTSRQLASLPAGILGKCGPDQAGHGSQDGGNDRGGPENPVGSRVDRDGTANSRRPRPGRGPVQIHLYRRADQYGAGGRGGGEEHAGDQLSLPGLPGAGVLHRPWLCQRTGRLCRKVLCRRRRHGGLRRGRPFRRHCRTPRPAERRGGDAAHHTPGAGPV